MSAPPLPELPGPPEDPRWLEEWKAYQDAKLFFATFALFVRSPKRFAVDFAERNLRVFNPLAYDLTANAALAALMALWPTIDRSKVNSWLEQMLILSVGLAPSLLIHVLFRWGGSKRSLRSTVAAVCFARGSFAVCVAAVIAPVVFLKARLGLDVLPANGFWFVVSSTGFMCLLAVTFVGLALSGMHRVRSVYGLSAALGFWVMSVVMFNLAAQLVVTSKPATGATESQATHAEKSDEQGPKQ